MSPPKRAQYSTIAVDSERSCRRPSVAVLHKLSNEYFRDIFTVGRDWLYKLLDANNMLLRETKKKRPPRMTRGVVNHGFEDHLKTITGNSDL